MSKATSILRKTVRPTLIVLGLILFAFLPFLVVNHIYKDKLLPNIYIAGTNVGGQNINSATQILSQNIKKPQKIKLVSEDHSFEISTQDIGLIYDFNQSVTRAYNRTHTRNFVFDALETVRSFFTSTSIGLTTNLDETKLGNFISVIDGQVSIEPTLASVALVNGRVEVNRGKAGLETNTTQLRANIGASLSYARDEDITIPTEKIDLTLNDEEVSKLQGRAERLVGKEIRIRLEPQAGVPENYKYTAARLLKFINPKGGVNESELASAITEVAKKINREPQNPKFNFDGIRVSEFEPALDGVKLDESKLKVSLVNAIEQFETGDNKEITIEAPITKTAPDVTTEKVNNLGIKELIGRGTSTYFHSIPGRVFNVSLATSRINGILVKPGETFSFNNALGDVSEFTGYQQAYIISNGKTILGDGGGVCQVSSTLFRSLLNAGLPITERAAHAYRVSYYEQNSPPGMDATVYGPSPDLKFTNDTGNYVLIVAKADPKHYSLLIELYGTKDGRVATISKPTVSNVSPALPTVYQDDPTLPAGTTKQVDFSASGAKVSFNYNVEKDGKSIFKKTFTSNYRPWAAVYLRGTGSAN